MEICAICGTANHPFGSDQKRLHLFRSYFQSFSDLFHSVFPILRCCLSMFSCDFDFQIFQATALATKSFAELSSKTIAETRCQFEAKDMHPLYQEICEMHLQDLAMPACQMMSTVFGNRCGKNTVWESE